ncbi:MAG: 30S ribosomal protein S1 [Gammaproteobacteria bacterium]|nr:30S ribosomal protein S1 [Gammaproteobacteria bacterium]
MTENFAELLKSTLTQTSIQVGSVLIGKVVRIEQDFVVVDVGLKSESIIPIEQFYNAQKELDIKLGDDVEVTLEALEDGWGATRVSREKAKRDQVWREIEAVYTKNQIIKGVIAGKVKGGFTVDVKSIKAFLPGSLVDVTQVREGELVDGSVLDLKVVKVDREKNNVVVSRRAVVEENSIVEREALLSKLEDGMELTGVVKNLTDYGAFVDLGGLDGLLHITDISWKRIKHPSEALKVGAEIKVKVIKFDKEKKRVSLGMKQLSDDPWCDIERRYPVSSRIFGTVTSTMDYGCFVEIEKGVEGLVHVSELSWTNKNIHPNKVVKPGDEIEVMVLEVDEKGRRISLGFKQCTPNPWVAFSENHKVGEKVVGKIKTLTDFGIFVGLEGDMDGLIHLSDISWQEAGEAAIKNYKKGQEVETQILAIDPDRERVSLGIKQLIPDPFTHYTEEHPKNSIVSGSISGVEANKYMVALAEEVQAILWASEIPEEGEDKKIILKVGDTVEAKVTQIDRKKRLIYISIKAKDVEEQKQALKKHQEDNKEKASASPKKTLGDLLKAQMDQAKKDRM